MSKSNSILSLGAQIDTRNALIHSKDGIQKLPNNDALYGPYSSKQEAWDALSEKTTAGVDGLVVGRTVLITENGRSVEYWFETDCKSIDDLVEKRASIIIIKLEAADGDEFSAIEISEIYTALTTFPTGAVFKGVKNNGDKFDLDVKTQPNCVIVQYQENNTIQEMVVDKITKNINLYYYENYKQTNN